MFTVVPALTRQTPAPTAELKVDPGSANEMNSGGAAVVRSPLPNVPVFVTVLVPQVGPVPLINCAVSAEVDDGAIVSEAPHTNTAFPAAGATSCVVVAVVAFMGTLDFAVNCEKHGSVIEAG